MFKEDMIAPCGLNCGICHESLRKENPCTGCLGPNETKSDYCANHCKIAVCEVRRSLPDRFCDQCPQFPCSEMVDKEIWYANTYPMVESLMGNLALLRKEGMEKFLQLEEERWKCGDCGGVICVHTGICSDCAKEYTIRTQKK